MKANRGIHHILSLVVKLYRRLLQKRNRTLLPWTEFRPFTDFIVVHPFVGVTPGENNVLQTKIGEDSGGFSTDEGLEPVPGELLDCNENWPPALGIYWIRIESKAACNGKTKSGYFDYIGQSRNLNPNARRETLGIFRRIQAHYLKILRLPQRNEFWRPGDPRREELAQQHFENYSEFRDFFRDESGNLSYTGTEIFNTAFELLTEHHDLDTHGQVKAFFKENVSLRFLNLTEDAEGADVPSRLQNVCLPEFQCNVNKAEAIALKAYECLYNEPPYLNTQPNPADHSPKEYKKYTENFKGANGLKSTMNKALKIIFILSSILFLVSAFGVLWINLW